MLSLAGRFLSQELPPLGVKAIWVPTVPYVTGPTFFLGETTNLANYSEVSKA